MAALRHPADLHRRHLFAPTSRRALRSARPPTLARRSGPARLRRSGQPDGRRPSCAARHALAATSSTAFPAPSIRPSWLDRETRRPTPVHFPIVAISIVVDYEQLLHRITGRRISPAGRIYNIYSNPPAVPGICDVDGSALVQRPDDSEAVFTERMKTFEAQTAPVSRALSQAGPLRRDERRPARRTGHRRDHQPPSSVFATVKRLAQDASLWPS